MGLAGGLAEALRAEYVPVGEVSAAALVGVVRPSTRSGASSASRPGTYREGAA